MKSSSSKAKGRQAEHDVIAELQAWWRRVEPNAVFMRTPRSGGWSTAGATGLKTMSDLCYDPLTCERWIFSVEVKHHKTVKLKSVENFLSGKPSPINKFWEQCTKAAAKDGMVPLLVFRGNRMPFRVAWMDPDGELQVRLLETFVTYDPWLFALAMDRRKL